MAKEWQKAGHHTVIVAASYAHVRTNQPVVKDIFLKADHLDLEYLFVRTPEYQGNGFKRVLNMSAFVKTIKRSAKKIAEVYKPDVVIASSTYPLDIYPARKIAKFAKAKLIYEVHDLWPLSPMELGGMSKYHPFILINQHAENYAYKHADKVVSMLPCTLEHMQKHGLKSGKFHYIPNGINVTEWENHEPLPKEYVQILDVLKFSGSFLVAYTGSHGLANSLDTLIEAAEATDIEDIKYVLVGSGPEKEKLENTVKSKGLKNVIFLPPVKKSMIPALLKYFDVLYLGLKKQSLFRFGISPNKLFDYMMAEKPIIQAIEAGNNPVKDANCGISVDAENPIAVKEAVIKLYKMSVEDRKKLGHNAKQYVLKYHDYSVLAKNFIKVMQE